MLSVLAVVAVALFVGSSVGPSGATALAAFGAPAPSQVGILLRPAGATAPISHIVIVFQENHVYDQYFGTYCSSVGPYCNLNGTGYPPGLCVPLDPSAPAQGCQSPYLAPSSLVTSPVDLVHDWGPAHEAYDNGSMDDFYLAEGKQISTFAYYNGAELPTYWDLAEEYGLGDNFFASVLSYSTPNHWYLLAGGAPNISLSQSFHRPVPNPPVLSPSMEQYLDEANNTETIVNLLANSTASWKYYDYSLSSYGQAINAQIGAGAAQSAFDFWNPLAAVASSYTPAMKSHFVSSSAFFTDAAAGNLPNVSWVLPTYNVSDHPTASLINGQGWVARIVNAVEASPDWNSSAIFITWDDYGGYYDHVPPPPLDATGVSFRAPLLVVSPYAREGYISHQFTYFESLLHLIEWRFGLASLTARDANAPLPLDYFDFGAPPRAPIHIGVPGTAGYPVPLQGLGAPRAPSGLTADAGPASVTLNWSLSSAGAGVTAYQLTYGPASAPTLASQRISGSLNGVTVSNLVAGTSYDFSLRSVVGNNASTPLSVVGVPLAGNSSLPPGQPATWTALPAIGGPGARAGAGWVYLATNHTDLLFGGLTAAGAYEGDTWEYTNGQWSQLNPVKSPPARAFAGMVYDSTDQTVVLFGGQGPNGPLGDTWKFSGGVWTNLTGVVGKGGSKVPSARAYPALADDPAAHGALLFGGLGAAGALGDTWRYAAGKWTSLTVHAAPAARWASVLTYDAKDGYALLFGGNASNGSALNDTWQYSSSAWHHLTTSASPGPSAGPTAVYDPIDQYVLLFGGARGGVPLSGTWRYVGGGWTLLAPASAPTPRTFASEIYDGGHLGVLFGFGSGATGDPVGLYTYGLPIAVTLQASPTFADAPALVSFFPTVTGGMAPYRYLWSFGDGARSTLTDATHSYALPGTYPASLTVFGAGGASATASVPVRVDGALSVTGAPLATSEGGVVTFESQVGGGLAPYNFSWNFGDRAGPEAWSVAPSHSYAVPGVYNVSVTVTDADGAMAVTTFAATTNGGTIPVTLSANVTSGAAPLSVQFTKGVNASAGVQNCTWSFGDGDDAYNGTMANHTFNASGRYVVTLNVSGPNGTWGTTFLVISVDDEMDLAPVAIGTSSRSGDPIALSAPVSGGTPPYAYRWLLGDGSVSTAPAPQHEFAAGTYTIDLTVTDSKGVRASSVGTITVAPTTAPVAPGADPVGGSTPAPGLPPTGAATPSSSPVVAANWGRAPPVGPEPSGDRRRARRQAHAARP